VLAWKSTNFWLAEVSISFSINFYLIIKTNHNQSIKV